MNIIFRTDASNKIGMGHFMRCIGLAQEFQSRGSEITFVSASPISSMVERIKKEQFELIEICAEAGSASDAKSTYSICKKKAADLLVADHYALKKNWFSSMRDNGVTCLLWTDFLQDSALPVSFILDQTPDASLSTYKRAAPGAQIFCGLKYSVLRREFLNKSNIRYRREELRHVLVTLGGADPDGVTQKVLSALRPFSSQLSIRVIIGPANHCGAEIRLTAQKFSNCEVFESVEDMAGMVAWADIAVSAAGTSLWEFAYSGLPALTTIIADNQLHLASALERLGGGINLGKANRLTEKEVCDSLASLIDTPENISSMSEVMMKIVDGCGVKRVVDSIHVALKV